MVAVTTHVYIDWDWVPGTTPDYSQPTDDISEYFMQASIRTGSNPSSRIAFVGDCSITVKNTTKAFSPDVSTGPFYGRLLPMKPVKVIVNDGTSNYLVFTGFTKAFVPQSGIHGQRRTKISCQDLMGLIQRSDIDIPLMEQASSSDLVLHIINYAMRAPIATGRFNFSAAGTNNDTVQVNGTTYRLRTTTAQANDVKIGTSAFAARHETIYALVSAINGWDTDLYDISSTRPDLVRASITESYYETIVSSQVVRYYRLGETSGSICYDFGSNVSPGTYNGSPALQATGAITNDTEGARTFDGVNDYVTLNPIDLNVTSFSLEMWYKPAASPPALQDLFNCFAAFTTNQAFWIRLTSAGALSANFFNGSTVSTTGISTGSWWHIVVTYDYSSSTLKLYINGALVSTATSAGPFTGRVFVSEIGGFSATGSFQYCKGDFDEVSFWYRVLSADEVSTHYAARSYPSPGVTLYSLLRGAIGNTFTMSESSSSITATGAVLSGGADAPGINLNIEEGLRTFAFAGDNWLSGSYNALTAMQDVVQSERGRAYVTRGGTITFENYATDFSMYGQTPKLDTTYNGTTYNIEADLESSVSETDIVNSVTVRFKPPAELGVGVVAQSTSPIKVNGRWGEQSSDPNRRSGWFAQGHPPGDPGQVVITLPYSDDTGNPIGAKDLVLPLVATTDWEANEESDGSGGDYTTYTPKQLFFSVANRASSCDVWIKNTALGVLWIRRLQIRGTKITRYAEQSVTKEDASSVELYGRRQKSIILPLEVEDNFATAIAEYELSRATNAFWRIKSLAWPASVLTDGLGNNIFNVEIGDLIKFGDAQTSDPNSYLTLRVVGITLGLGLLNNFTLNFDVEVIDDQIYGIFNNSMALYDQCLFTI